MQKCAGATCKNAHAPHSWSKHHVPQNSPQNIAKSEDRTWLVAGYFGTKNNGRTRSKCRWSVFSSRPFGWHVWSHTAGERVRKSKSMERTRTRILEICCAIFKNIRISTDAHTHAIFFVYILEPSEKQAARNNKTWNLLIPSRLYMVKTQSEPLKRFELLSSLKEHRVHFVPKVQRLVIPCSQRKSKTQQHF